ncbi:hypothetical protein Leryth_023307 [Lithospermum erythrorhizon]|uniref:Cystatin domain-containing protein n=1 Tax=Lithospermum erythrorhizon TaxID=34254 RepID=A0AAV3Q0T5_LITER|nr:hypothetical protein Leryth_023307 [Lithospermum erythrorhizon]
MENSTFPCSLFLLLTILTLISFHQVNGAGSPSPSPGPGGQPKTTHVKVNKEIEDLAKSCVDQYNTRMYSDIKTLKLVYGKVVEAAVQSVSGFNKYYLKINVTYPDKTPKTFNAVSAVKPGGKTGELETFTLS